MTIPFDIAPASSIFRTAINGDNAASPSSLKNVMFDAFGAKLHGMTLGGVVPWSSFAGPYVNQLYYPSLHLSNPYFQYTYTFPQALAYCPIVVVLWQLASGAWTDNYAVTSGSITQTGLYYTSATQLVLQLNTSSSAGFSAYPLAASYRLFGV